MLDFALTPTDFRSRYFERAPLLSRRVLQERPIGWRELNDALNRIEPDERTLALFDRGLVPQSAYTRDGVELGQQRRRLDKLRFYALLRNGATLVLKRFEMHSVESQRLCAEVSRFAGLPTTSNAYLSYTGNGTFGKHWDTHDVFAIQLFGRKRWQVFAPTFALPLSHHTSESFPQTNIGVAQLDLVLEPGDVLYLPRGWWHQAIPLNEPSLHLSVGTYTATLHDYLMWICSRLLPLQPAARQALCAESAAATTLTELFDVVRSAATDATALRQFEHEIQRREGHHGELDLARHVNSWHEPREGNARLRLTSSCAAAPEPGRILVNGQFVALDPLAQRVVSVLRSCASMQLDALCERVNDVPRDLTTATVYSLAALDVLSIEPSLK